MKLQFFFKENNIITISKPAFFLNGVPSLSDLVSKNQRTVQLKLAAGRLRYYRKAISERRPVNRVAKASGAENGSPGAGLPIPQDDGVG